MACTFICDGCGKKTKAQKVRHDWRKPHNWFQRSDDDGIQDACSRECVDKVAEKTGKTQVVAPF